MHEYGLWGIATVVGPIVLLIAFAWVIMRNRLSTVSKDVTERATKANYEAEDRAHRDEDV